MLQLLTDFVTTIDKNYTYTKFGLDPFFERKEGPLKKMETFPKNIFDLHLFIKNNFTPRRLQLLTTTIDTFGFSFKLYINKNSEKTQKKTQDGQSQKCYNY